jgi:YbbR domain-containing protein
MAENSIFRLLLKLYIKLKTFLFSKNALSFLLFLALSSGFWFMNALDKERETNISIPLRFVGLSHNIMVTNELPERINVIVKDQGINLLSYSRNNMQEIVFDVEGVFYEKGKIRISSDQIRGKLSRFLLASTSIIEIKPDSLMLQYEKLSSKTLPIELDAKLQFKQQYILSEKVRLTPDKMTVFGPKQIIDTLKSIKTERLVLDEIDDSLSLSVRLLPIRLVKFASDETRLNLFVEMFTEKKFELPVKVINCPENIAIRTFPAKVNVSFNVGLSQFNAVNSRNLQVVFDYNDIVLGAQTKQLLKISTLNPHISNLTISPSEVEYLIEVL